MVRMNSDMREDLLTESIEKPDKREAIFAVVDQLEKADELGLAYSAVPELAAEINRLLK